MIARGGLRAPHPAATHCALGQFRIERDTIQFTARTSGRPGEYICAEAHFLEGGKGRRAGILVGPEYGTLSRGDQRHRRVRPQHRGHPLRIAVKVINHFGDEVMKVFRV